MKFAYRTAIPVLLISALAACDRDNASETAQAPGAPLPLAEPLTTERTAAPAPPAGNVEVATATQSPSESAAAATDVQTPAATGSASAGTPQASIAPVASTSPEYTKSMEQLQAAAQRLREATQAMAQQPAGERRNQAIRQANQALIDTQDAMMRLPPEMRTEAGATAGGSSAASTASTGGAGTQVSASSTGTSASAAPGGTTASAGTPTAGSQSHVGTTASPAASGLSGGTSATQYDAAHARVMDKLLGASQQLREALQELAQQPSSALRDQAMKEARQALYDTQQAMIRLPTTARPQQ